MRNTLIAIAGIIAALAIGRYTAPIKEKIKIEERIVEKEVVKYKERENQDEQKNTETVIIETIFPDGTIKKETRIVDRGHITIDRSKELDKQKTTEKEKIITAQIGVEKDWNAALIASPSHSKYNLIPSSISAGILVQRRIAGPFSVNVFGLTNQTFGAGVGFSW